jgi:ABC-type amino acid transport substrate-binding protein
MVARLVAGIALLLLTVAGAEAATLDRVRDQGVFRIGYRTDAVPFAYNNPQGAPAGYIVDLCRAVASEVKRQLRLANLKIDYVPVTAENGFAAVKDGQVDILCGPTTETLARRALVDFSLMTFIDGASVIYRKGGPLTFTGLAGHKVGVRAGTTTEKELRGLLAQRGINAQIVPVGDHKQGFDRLAKGELTAYFADRSILAYMLSNDPRVGDLLLSDQYFSNEPYALALPRGDTDFRMLVDGTLARLYRSGDVERIYGTSFGRATPNAALRALFMINGLPD